MLYTEQIPENAQIPPNIKVLNHFDETDVFGTDFCIVVAELTEEQLEIVKKRDKCPIYFDIKSDTGFNYALSLAVIGFIQEPNALSQAGLTNTWGMSFDEIDSRLMCSAYIDHINTYRNDNKLGNVTADLLIARYLDMLELEIKALNNKI